MVKRLAACVVLLLAATSSLQARPGGARLRVATFNIADLNPQQDDPTEIRRLQQVAAIILDIEPDIILLNEIDQDEDCTNAQAFADHYLAVSQGEHEPMRYSAFMRPTNTGAHSGLDLDNNGTVTSRPGSREYAGDCLGFGEYPGQYAMALLVREGLTIDDDHVRTFKNFLWKDMPGALLPPMPDGSGPWYTDEELAILPLSSKSHWDVPVVLESGAVVHILASHPTPPVFDGPEDRNGRRNHDEIRFWADYITSGDTAAYIRDDHGNTGGLAPDAHFVIVGDLNADPARGDSRDNPMNLLLTHDRVAKSPVPFSVKPLKNKIRGNEAVLSDESTTKFDLRVDYVLASVGIEVERTRIYRSELDLMRETDSRRDNPPTDRKSNLIHNAEDAQFTYGDHFPVYADLIVPPPQPRIPATIKPVPSGRNP